MLAPVDRQIGIIDPFHYLFFGSKVIFYIIYPFVDGLEKKAPGFLVAPQTTHEELVGNVYKPFMLIVNQRNTNGVIIIPFHKIFFLSHIPILLYSSNLKAIPSKTPDSGQARYNNIEIFGSFHKFKRFFV
jgi:hypothetical protein